MHFIHFCGKHPFASGIQQSPLARLRTIGIALLHASYAENSAFAIAMRKTQDGYEWRLFEVPLLLRLLRKQTRYEHLVQRKTGGFKIRIARIAVDGLDRLYLEPAVDYLKLLGTHKPKKLLPTEADVVA